MKNTLSLVLAIVVILLAYGITGNNDYDDEVRLAQEIRRLCQPAHDLSRFRPAEGLPALSRLGTQREASTVSALRCRVLN
jgi:hypothetical protein